MAGGPPTFDPRAGRNGNAMVNGLHVPNLGVVQRHWICARGHEYDNPQPLTMHIAAIGQAPDGRTLYLDTGGICPFCIGDDMTETYRVWEKGTVPPPLQKHGSVEAPEE